MRASLRLTMKPASPAGRRQIAVINELIPAFQGAAKVAKTSPGRRLPDSHT
jgi:hypothetical protein